MTTSSEFSVFSLSQPDLLTTQELIDVLKARCCRLDNLESMTKENLVDLFRRMIVPLPQRSYRNDHRGKMLTARRVKSGLERSRETRGEEGAAKGSKDNGRSSSTEIGNRLKPPPTTTSGKIRTSASSDHTSSHLDRIVINDRRKSSHCDNTNNHSSSPSKRSHETTSSDLRSESGGKKQRVAIKWP